MFVLWNVLIHVWITENVRLYVNVSSFFHIALQLLPNQVWKRAWQVLITNNYFHHCHKLFELKTFSILINRKCCWRDGDWFFEKGTIVCHKTWSPHSLQCSHASITWQYLPNACIFITSTAWRFFFTLLSAWVLYFFFFFLFWWPASSSSIICMQGKSVIVFRK